MIDNLDGFLEIIIFNQGRPQGDSRPRIGINQKSKGDMYCPTCGDKRRISVESVYTKLNYESLSQAINNKILSSDTLDDVGSIIKSYLTPSLWLLSCLQCNTLFTALIYQKIDGTEFIILPSCNGGLTTPNTPDGVAFYLDQASKSKYAGAYSASMAMYRGALEHILYEQGYKVGMLGKKISNLCTDIDNKIAPQWAMELDTDLLKYLKDLGNGSIHANDGDIEQQKIFDKQLLIKVDDFFKIIIFTIYELPKKLYDMKVALRDAAQNISR